MNSQIVSTGSYLPARVVRNEDLHQFPVESIPLIASKTGILFRRYAHVDESTSDLALKASRICLERAGIGPLMVDGIILATSSPDQPMPATAAVLQAKLGASNAFAVDVNAVCSGAAFALTIGDSMIKSGSARRILIVAAEVYSRLLNKDDFSTCPYFGDGAGAVLLEAGHFPDRPFILGGILRSDGRGADLIKIAAGGSKMPFAQVTDPRQVFFQMNGKAVFEFAVTRASEMIGELCSKFGIGMSTLSAIFLHQANINIVKAIASRTHLPESLFPTNLQFYGNTAAASALIVFDEYLTAHIPNPLKGPCLIVTFGGGLSWGGVAVGVS